MDVFELITFAGLHTLHYSSGRGFSWGIHCNFGAFTSEQTLTVAYRLLFRQPDVYQLVYFSRPFRMSRALNIPPWLLLSCPAFCMRLSLFFYLADVWGLSTLIRNSSTSSLCSTVSVLKRIPHSIRLQEYRCGNE